MDSHQAHIVEYSGTVQLQMLIIIKRGTNISLTELYFGMPNSFLKHLELLLMQF